MLYDKSLRAPRVAAQELGGGLYTGEGHLAGDAAHSLTPSQHICTVHGLSGQDAGRHTN